MSILAASITTSANAAIDKSVGADFIITADHFAPVSTDVATQARGVPGVGSVTEFRAGAMKVGGSTKQVQGVTSTTVIDTLRLEVTSGSANDVNQGAVLISEQTAKSKHLHVGSSLPVEFALTEIGTASDSSRIRVPAIAAPVDVRIANAAVDDKQSVTIIAKRAGTRMPSKPGTQSENAA